MPPMTSDRNDDPRTVADWFRQVRVSTSPGAWLTILLVTSLAGFHLVWLIGGGSYSRPMIATVGVWTSLGVLLAVFGRTGGFALRAGMRTVLFLAGAAVLLTGVALLVDLVDLGGRTLTEVSAAGLFFVGCYVMFTGFYLGDDDRTADIGKPVSEQKLTVAGVDALLRRYRGFSLGATDRIVDICKSQLSTTDLHYVAYFVNRSCWFYLDAFDDTKLERFFGIVDVEKRREEYVRLGHQVSGMVGRLNHDFRQLDVGMLIRTVFDVERGALYYYWVDDRRYIVGVTLDQDRVEKADRKMVQLVDSIRESLGHKRLGDLDR